MYKRKIMNSEGSFFSTQYQGILAGLLIAIIGMIILFCWKKIIYFFKNIPMNLYKRKLEKDISESLGLANKEIGLTFFPEVKLKIVPHELPPEEIGNKIIIFLKKENKPSAFSNIIAHTLDISFLKDSKRFIDSDLYGSAKYLTGKSLITYDNLPDQLDIFKREALRYYERKMEDLLLDGQVLTLIDKEKLIISKRMFKTVLLQELYALGERMIGEVPSARCKEESVKLVEFLYNNSRMKDYNLEKGVLPPLQFIGSFFKLGLVLVKRADKADISSHLKAVRVNIKKGVHSIYILGWGKNIKRIKGDFVDWLKQISIKDYDKKWQLEKILECKMPKIQGRENISRICLIFRHKLWLP